MRCPFDCGLANYAGSSCRVLEHVDGDAVCAAEIDAKVVLAGSEDVDAFYKSGSIGIKRISFLGKTMNGSTA